MLLTIIAAMTENRVLGRGGVMPWHLPADLKHFQRHTIGHACIMGRKTFEAMNGPLPRRTNIVLTHDESWEADGVIVAHTLDEALARISDDEQSFIIGGAEIYRLALPRVERMELTIIHTTLEGDTFFPEVSESEWHLAAEQRREADDRNAFAMTFQSWDRIT